ncbi:MAG: hypothetical protein AAFY21_19570, partial [Cyanobacteria bacterium J06641_2]
ALSITTASVLSIASSASAQTTVNVENGLSQTTSAPNAAAVVIINSTPGDGDSSATTSITAAASFGVNGAAAFATRNSDGASDAFAVSSSEEYAEIEGISLGSTQSVIVGFFDQPDEEVTTDTEFK